MENIKPIYTTFFVKRFKAVLTLFVLIWTFITLYEYIYGLLNECIL